MQSIEAKIEMLQGAERDLLELLSGDGGQPLAYSFLQDPEKVQTLENIAKGSTRLPTLGQGGLALGQYLSAEETAARIGMALGPVSMMSMAASGFDDTGAPSLGEGTRRGIIPALRPPLRFLDLIPSVTVEGKSTDYVQESGSLLTARETAHGALKPVADATYDDATAEHKTIAHFLKINRQQLADTDELERRLRDRLAYGVLHRLEGQIITGDGIGDNIEGILNTTGIASVAFVSGEKDADQILRGIADVLLSGAQPNVVALAVNDWVDILIAKSGGSEEYLNIAGPFAAAANALWNTTTVPVPSLAPGTALVGDTRLGARVLVREGVNVVAGQESDDLVRNSVTLLGEGRFGLEVDQPSAFCAVDLAA